MVSNAVRAFIAQILLIFLAVIIPQYKFLIFILLVLTDVYLFFDIIKGRWTFVNWYYFGTFLIVSLFSILYILYELTFPLKVLGLAVVISLLIGIFSSWKEKTPEERREERRIELETYELPKDERIVEEVEELQREAKTLKKAQRQIEKLEEEGILKKPRKAKK